MTFTLMSSSPDETLAIGRRMGALLVGGEIILMKGDLGAGKTVMVKGIAMGLGSDPHVPVTSPSFTLVNIYHARLDIVHVDLYRLESGEIPQLGLEDYLDKDHVLIVEWADRAEGYFTDSLVEIAIFHEGVSTRRITVVTDLAHVATIAESLCGLAGG